ncbi:MAG: hypothetical protein CL398_07415 [Acidiferrobacteraceae bacterium]|nr:hypothetical protein [Acidiferrobacteraceae bacterium]|tara:strand:- start:3444 stop:3800 length:357 start_codon:yes stop_codon:yes gene_type:complete
MWNKKRRTYGKNNFYSLSKKLHREGRVTDEFEMMLNSLSLEEVIGLKLEIASRIVGGKMYGLPLWHSMENITKNAVLMYVLSASRTKMEAARFLGVTKEYFNKLCKKYDAISYFEENA